MLIILSGLPASGKTTLGRALAAETGAVYLRIDTIEQALKRSSLKLDPVEDAGYAAAMAAAGDNLELGRIVIADSVNPIELTRQAWREVARKAGSDFVDVEIICSDRMEHRRRVEARGSDIEGLVQPKWADVEARDYESWSGAGDGAETNDRILIDTAGREAADSLAELIEALPRMA